MWPFRKYNPLGAFTFAGFVDCHSHILPGVDDGVQTLEEALSILARYEALGVAEVWLTPHIMEDMPNTPPQLRARLAELQAAYDGGVQLHLAAENMIDPLFAERLACGELLPFGAQGDRLLVETSYFNPPIAFYDTLQQIRTKGFTPLLAHPERYMYMDRADYGRLKELGVEFQLNLLSLTGFYGKPVREKAEWLRRNGFYACSGTDLHGLEMLGHLTR